MLERAFEITNLINYDDLTSRGVDAADCDLPSGIDGEWEQNGDGWAGEAEDIGRMVGWVLKDGETCVFKFVNKFDEKTKEKFYKGLLDVLRKKETLTPANF